MRKKYLVIIFFVCMALAATFPLIFKITTHIPGFFSSDELYAPIWDSWRIKYSFLHHDPLGHTALIAHPFGVDMYRSGFTSYLWSAWFFCLSLLTTHILTYNIQVLYNFFLNGIIVYLLVLYLTKSRQAGIFSGIIFAFCPYQFARAWQHLSLTYNEWIPLVLLGAVLLKEQYSRKTAIIFLVSLLLCFSFDWSIMYLTAVTMAVFISYVLAANWKTKFFKDRKLLLEDLDYIKKVAMLGIIVFTILFIQFLPVIVNSIRPSHAAQASAFNSYRRPFQDLFTQSAKPLSYFLPATSHPVFGRFTEQFIGSPLYGVSYTEHALYLGWVPLILAFITFGRRRKNKRLSAISYQLSARDDFYIGFFIWLAIVAWAFSQPPYFTFPYFKIYMPSFFMYKMLPMFRAYCRFGIVVMLAVAVLAGFGLKFILEKLKSNKTKIVFTSLVCGLVLFEFLNFPPFKVIDLSSHPKVYDWLKGQKGDLAIAEYPLDTDGSHEYYKFCQTIHEKKIINGTIPGTYANKVAKGIWKLSEPGTAQALSWMKVKYVLVHLRSYEKSNDMEFVSELERVKTRTMPGLRFIKSFDDTDVYEVTAAPRELDIHE